MKPVKPKKLSRRLEAALNERAARETTTQHLTPAEAVREIHSRSEARAILAALEYERQRAEKAEAGESNLRRILADHANYGRN